MYQITMSDNLQLNLQSIPQKVQTRLVKEGYDRLRNNPAVHEPPTIKKLKRYKDYYRLRIQDHRAIYCVDQDSKTVTLLIVGHRNKVYDQLGYDTEKEQPSARIVANEQVHHLLERQPEPEEFAQAFQRVLNEPPPPEPGETHDDPLPNTFNAELIDRLGIELPHRSELLKCQTGGQLLDSPVPDDVKKKILDALYPKPIEQIVDEPKRMVDSAESLQQLAEGRSLDSFLLALDDTQKPLTERFNGNNLQGPWLVKGGPGSGKSTVALYCIRNLLRANQATLPLESKPIRILLTTYTKSLVNASSHLLKALGAESARQQVDIVNVDKLVRDCLPSDWNRRAIYGAKSSDWRAIVEACLEAIVSRDEAFSFNMDDHEFLYDELDSVLIGNEITSLEGYASFKRAGRGRKLGKNQRQQIWNFSLEAEKELEKRRHCLPSHQFATALKSIQPKYDYVFIDEAQDLDPVALRMCKNLALNPKNVFLTADRNQSIYTSGFSWKRVAEDLNFQGRSTIFKRNYRTTHEIIDAIRSLLTVDEDIDDETINDQPVRFGEIPALRLVDTQTQEVNVLKDWITSALLKERVSYDSAAVLCPTNNDCKRIAQALPPEFKARSMKSREVNIGHPGVKVMTMHAAKGMEFPVVAVVGLNQDFPWSARGGLDQEESDKRLRRTFFVACSRAMRRLLVIGDRSYPSKFLEGFDEEHWDVS